MTLLCASIFVSSTEQAVRDAVLAAESGADLVEYRLDHFDPRGDPGLIARSPLPCIVTCRSQSEGGESDLSDHDRLALLNSQLQIDASYADVERSAFANLTRELLDDKRYIISSHNFRGRPERVYNIISEMNATPAGVIKIAWTARSIRENIEAFEIVQTREKPTIAICMGEAGLISRVLAKKFGAFLTYASLRPTEATAPGQPTIDELKKLYRWDAINPKTKVFGVVGAPVAHSMSPTVHNAAFDASGLDGVYLPMLVEPSYESFKAFMTSFTDFSPLDLSGLSITAPHKENALRYLKAIGATIDPLAQMIGTVNTIKIERVDGGTQLRGFNTDHDALLDAITTALKMTREHLAELRFAIIGAGGIARTAVASLANLGATIVIYNRTQENADILASEFDGKTGRIVAARIEKLCDSCCHVFINCTPVGIHPNVDESPLSERIPSFTSDTLVFDTIYNPPKTKLLRQAETAGAKTLNGGEMFLAQAAAQFEAWTKLPAPRDAMRRALEERLITR